MSRRRRRRHRKAAIWLLAIVLAGMWQVTGVFHWLLILPAGGMMLVAPLALVGTREAMHDFLVPQYKRAEQRRPYIDPLTGREKRPARPAVPKWLRTATYAADRYRCIYCGRTRRQGAVLNWDHIIPWDFGGLTSLWNGGTLCSDCNKIKSNYYRSKTGKVYYGRWGHDHHTAAKILRAELAARWSVLRWVRAGRTWWVLIAGK